MFSSTGKVAQQMMVILMLPAKTKLYLYRNYEISKKILLKKKKKKSKQSFLGARTSPLGKHGISELCICAELIPYKADLLNRQRNSRNILLYFYVHDNCLIWDLFLLFAEAESGMPSTLSYFQSSTQSSPL